MCVGGLEMYPLITNSVAALVYKTHVLPMLDYGDFLVDSGKLSKIDLTTYINGL